MSSMPHPSAAPDSDAGRHSSPREGVCRHVRRRAGGLGGRWGCCCCSSCSTGRSTCRRPPGSCSSSRRWAPSVRAPSRWILRPLRSKLTLSDVAGTARRTPTRSSTTVSASTVNFLGGTDIPGSEPMKQRVVEPGERAGGRVKLDEAVTARPAWYSVAGGARGRGAASRCWRSLVGPNFLQDRRQPPALRRCSTGPRASRSSLVGTMPKRVAGRQAGRREDPLTKGDGHARPSSTTATTDGRLAEGADDRRGRRHLRRRRSTPNWRPTRTRASSSSSSRPATTRRCSTPVAVVPAARHRAAIEARITAAALRPRRRRSPSTSASARP